MRSRRAQTPLRRWGGWVAAAALLAGCAPHGRGLDPRHPFVRHPPKVLDPELGESASLPAGITVTIDDRAFEARHWLGGIGALADAALFSGPEYPLFRLTVAFSCARTDLSGTSPYADPRSPWFNVFFGFYQVEAPPPWRRPFAHEPDGRVRFEDMLRLGKADWNYLSNRIYGVPGQYADVTNPIDGTEKTAASPSVPIGKLLWNEIEMRQVEVVSPYASGGKSTYTVFDRALTPLWQRSFGVHPPVEGETASFFPVRMRALGLLCFTEMATGGFKTFVFGAAVREDAEDPVATERLLALQMRALRDAAGNLSDLLLVDCAVDPGLRNSCCGGTL
jgi:hypothetical protein